MFWDDKFSLMAAHTLGNVIVFWGNPSIWVRAVVVYYKASGGADSNPVVKSNITMAELARHRISQKTQGQPP
ncbi:MAG: hypothetical protein EBR82_74855, partial [Caulobacteraceae bacterium]|nr:hypothetical protein [Caulobacteraceae bacterium]